ncbi:MAG TPA: hypothetical protein VFQ53_24100 [Kofleriaceae bacterium]|nr:hypothetical protein [Kofleriaceae bacterium]
MLCEQGCSMGTCEAGVCVIDCTLPGSCATADVICPANLPCRVECGELSCIKKVNCELSTACTVLCSGDGSCHDEIKCGLGPCDVTCSGVNSCDRRTKCGTSCSCDVSCTGSGSCGEASECPTGTPCRVGNGCTSQLTGCDRC